MTAINLCFEVHQPRRLKWFWPDVARDAKGNDLEKFYFDDEENEKIFKKVADRCYFPANTLILDLIDKFKNQKKKFKITYSITGTFLEQCEKYSKDLMETFKQLSKTNCVEFLDETYYHSLTSLFPNKENFIDEVKLHNKAMKEILNYSPKIFKNTEMLYNNEIAKIVENLGYKGIFTEGIEWILDYWKSPNFLYKAKNSNLKVFLRNYRLSDDIAFRFSFREWNEFPLTADKYAKWLSNTNGEIINLFMDYETFGEHQWKETGIFEFLKFLPEKILEYENLEFSTPSECVEKYDAVGEIDVPWYRTISWADSERDHTAWLGNHNQLLCFSEIQRLYYLIEKIKNEETRKIYKRILRFFTTSDHFHYMSTKNVQDQAIHNYFSNRNNAYDAAINFLALISDLKEKILFELMEDTKKENKEKQITEEYNKDRYIEQLKNEIAANKNTIEEMKKEIENKNKEIEILNDKIKEMESEIEKNKSEKQERDKIFMRLKDEITANKNTIEEMKKEIENKNREIKILNDKIAVNKNTIEEMKKEIENKNKEIEILNDKIKYMEREIKKNKSEKQERDKIFIFKNEK